MVLKDTLRRLKEDYRHCATYNLYVALGERTGCEAKKRIALNAFDGHRILIYNVLF